MRRLAFALLVAGALAGPVRAARPLRPCPVPQEHFTLALPADWDSLDMWQARSVRLYARFRQRHAVDVNDLRRGGGGGSVLIAIPQHGGTWEPVMEVSVFTLQSGMSVEQLVRRLAKNAASRFNLISPYRSRVLTLPGGRAVEAQYATRVGTGASAVESRNYDIFFGRGGRLYVIGFVWGAATAAPPIQAIANSFRFTQ